MSSAEAEESDDIVFVERSDGIRIIVSIDGEFSFADRRTAHGERRVYECRAVTISPRSVTLLTAIPGKVGERVIAQIEPFGRLEGYVKRILGRGFLAGLTHGAEDQRSLARKIEWFEKHKHHDINDKRAHERIVPRDQHSTLIMPDGTSETCVVRDISVAGAAVLASTIPPIGTVVAIGVVVARVVRQFKGGFAVQFVERQHGARVEDKVVRT